MRLNGSGPNRPPGDLGPDAAGDIGIDLCRAIRAESDVPIIMVTAKDSEADKVTGLELGADDYVTKPFSVRELVSRVRALLRRTRLRPDELPADVLAGGPVEMDVVRHEVAVGGQAASFPPKEFELLETFLRRKGRLLTRDFLIEEVWDPTTSATRRRSTCTSSAFGRRSRRIRTNRSIC